MQEKNEPYKVELIQDLPEDAVISFYKQGEFTDLCAGPHMESTGQIKALLGPKTEARPDYLTRTYKSLSDYSGMYALWFVFAK